MLGVSEGECLAGGQRHHRLPVCRGTNRLGRLPYRRRHIAVGGGDDRSHIHMRGDQLCHRRDRTKRRLAVFDGRDQP
ncbi:Uncharacterised protein [Mycobacteroides abscessus subsp. massiliense]|nr:Uncharacterised protein [Mycobacteroides abscessus subsp. massiliense]